ncbi:MAG TPA: hypothetical protein VED46_07480 [Alphaproteobacteria bacterium]|nr:hypothetical protein [Alphaproteobacteria bacterium]
MSRRIFDWTMVLVTTLLCLLVFEGAARLIGFAPGATHALAHEDDNGWSAPDPTLGWVNKSGMARSTEAGNALMSFSADGSRVSPLLHGEKALLKVLVVGCSFTQGYGVADDETYVHFLNQRFPQIRFENFGTAGYNTLQSTMMAERLLMQWQGRERPALVIYGLLSDHLRRNVSSGKFIMSLIDADGRYISPPHARLRGQEFELEPYRELAPWPFERRSVILSLIHRLWINYAYDVDGSEAEEVTRRIVERFDQTVRANGSRPLVAILKRDRPIEKLVRPGSVEALDCSHPNYGTDPALRTGGTTGHPSAALHRHYADCIGDWIEQRLGELGS